MIERLVSGVPLGAATYMKLLAAGSDVVVCWSVPLLSGGLMNANGVTSDHSLGAVNWPSTVMGNAVEGMLAPAQAQGLMPNVIERIPTDHANRAAPKRSDFMRDMSCSFPTARHARQSCLKWPATGPHPLAVRW